MSQLDSPPDQAAQISALLGGDTRFAEAARDPLKRHRLMLEGLSYRHLRYLASKLSVISGADFLEKTVGISLRTFQRHRQDDDARLDPHQSGRLWTVASMLVTAMDVFGSQEAAERWLTESAPGLDGQRPLDLLASPPGVGIVEDHLERLAHGVYT